MNMRKQVIWDVNKLLSNLPAHSCTVGIRVVVCHQHIFHPELFSIVDRSLDLLDPNILLIWALDRVDLQCFLVSLHTSHYTRTYSDNVSYRAYNAARLECMEIELYEPPSEPPRVPRAAVDAALIDARSIAPANIHRTVALSVAHGSEKTAKLRLERLARVVMATDGRITRPEQVWSSDWSQLPAEAYEAIDRGIGAAWDSPSTRNAMRDSVRAVIRESRNSGLLTYDQAHPMLHALRPEKLPRDTEKQARGHISESKKKQIFEDLANEQTLTARRDAALIALMLGAGLRRDETTIVDLGDLDEHHETLVVYGKGGAVRDVPLAPGVRRALRAWLQERGDEPGPLMTPVTKTKPRQAVLDRRLSPSTVAQVVMKRFSDGTMPHDLRRTFTGDLLDSGADLSVVSQILGHVSPATTAGYDRRGHKARRAAVEKLDVPF